MEITSLPNPEIHCSNYETLSLLILLRGKVCYAMALNIEGNLGKYDWIHQ